jgi:hypothetical protein
MNKQKAQMEMLKTISFQNREDLAGNFSASVILWK